GGPELGQLAFGEVRGGGKEELGDGELEDGIAQKLEALVVTDAGVLGGVGTVGQGFGQNGTVLEGVAQDGLQRCDSLAHPAASRSPTRRTRSASAPSWAMRRALATERAREEP